jgi:hypothetical protein
VYLWLHQLDEADMPTAYTKPQIKALTYAFEKNGALYAPGALRAGGAFRRCCERLATEHLLADDPPFAITIRGLKALRDIRAAKWSRHGCMAYQHDLEKVDAALAEFPALAARVA